MTSLVSYRYISSHVEEPFQFSNIGIVVANMYKHMSDIKYAFPRAPTCLETVSIPTILQNVSEHFILLLLKSP